MDQIDQHGHLYQGTDNRGKGLAGVNTENGDRHCDRQLKVVGSGRKRQGSGLAVMCPHFSAQVKGDDKHENKIDQKRYGNANHIHGDLNDIFAL